MIGLLRAARKLVLGETVALPAGIAAAVAAAGVLRVVAGPGGWWQHAGGAVLAGLLVVALAVALRPRR